MPRRLEVTATSTESTLIVPLPRVSLPEVIDAGGKLPDGTRLQVYPTVNNALVPPLISGWTGQVLSLFPEQLRPAEFQTLEAGLNNYVRGRVALKNPITWDDYESRLLGFAGTSRALLDELDNQTPAYDLAWSKICEEVEATKLNRDDLYPLLSAVHAGSMRALERARARRAEGLKGDYAAPWTALVHTLAKLFESAGGKATAPKSRRDGSYADPSPFVELVWTMMSKAIPIELREYTHSKGAMTDAVSTALSKRANPGGGNFFLRPSE